MVAMAVVVVVVHGVVVAVPVVALLVAVVVVDRLAVDVAEGIDYDSWVCCFRVVHAAIMKSCGRAGDEFATLPKSKKFVLLQT